MSEITPVNVNHLNGSEVFKDHLEAALSSIKDLIITLDRNWCYTYVNHSMLELSGRKREDFLGQRIWELFPDAVDTLLFQEMQRAMIEQQPVQFEYLYPAWNRWFECRVYPSENGISLLSTDITVRKQAQQRRDIQYTVTRILAEASTLKDAQFEILQVLCESLGWQLATLWSVDRQANCLYYSDSWRSPATDAQALIETNQQTTFAPGMGLPGRVWMHGQPLWIADLSKDSNFPRADAAIKAGLKAIFGFPILLSNEVLGIIECFCDRAQAPDEDLLNMMVAIGSQIGQFMERKRTEAALKDSEELFQSFMNNSPLAAFIKDETGRYVYANTWVERVYQRSRAELVGKTDFEILPPKIAQQFHKNDLAVLTSKQPMQVLETICHEDGEHSYMSFKFPFCNAAGQQLLAGVAIDVSEQIQTQEILQKNEERLRIAQQAANAGVWDWDMVTNQVTWSEEYYRLYGLNPATTQASYQNWLSSILEPDREQCDRAAREALERGTDLNVEFRILHPTEGERWLTAIGQTFYDENGQPQRMTGIALDITARKQAEASLLKSEERYRYLAESIPQLVWTADATGVLIDVNQRWSNFTGLTPMQAQTEGWQAVVHPEDLPLLAQSWAFAQQNGTYYQAEGRMRRADGTYRWHLHQAVPLKNEGDEVIKWFGTATDIEDQKQLEQQRIRLLQQEQAAREQAEAANRIKDEFLAVLSHELRSPLNPILGWAKLLQSRRFDEKTFNKAIETIERNARLQTQLIEDLLDVSRILRGKLSLTMDIVHLSPTLESALDTVRLAAEAKHIQIQTYSDSSLGAVLGDSARLQQIIWNLLSNAIKFTPEGGKVEVRLERVEAEGAEGAEEAGEAGGVGEWGSRGVGESEEDKGDKEDVLYSQQSPVNSQQSTVNRQQSTVNSHQSTVNSHQSPVISHQSPIENCYAQITVKDTGRGISAEFLPFVFDYFRQADGTTTRKFGGLGLGLAIVRHLVELHGGTVRAESPGEGQGATFTVKLPLLRERETLAVSQTGDTTTDDAATLPLTGINILVVEDEEDNRDFLTFILEQAGANVTVATSAYLALEILAQSKPDILISDIGMPEMDGYTLLRQIRKLEASQGSHKIPAIALTAYAGEINQQQALAAGFQQHISKPVEPEELLKAIINLKGRR